MSESSDKIKAKISKLHARLAELEQRQERVRLKLKHVRDLCPHEHVKSWTNNDGDGQFTVNRCLDCQLQCDGPLK